MFSAGAVDVMMERQLWANRVFGVSAGALTGVNYVSRQVGRTAQVNLDFVNDKRYLGLGNLIFKRASSILTSCSGRFPTLCCPWTGRDSPARRWSSPL